MISPAHDTDDADAWPSEALQMMKLGLAESHYRHGTSAPQEHRATLALLVHGSIDSLWLVHTLSATLHEKA